MWVCSHEFRADEDTESLSLELKEVVDRPVCALCLSLTIYPQVLGPITVPQAASISWSGL